jgi:hypothetical protein
VKSTGYPLHSPVSPSLPLPCVTVCRHISAGLNYNLTAGLNRWMAFARNCVAMCRSCSVSRSSDCPFSTQTCTSLPGEPNLVHVGLLKAELVPPPSSEKEFPSARILNVVT